MNFTLALLIQLTCYLAIFSLSPYTGTLLAAILGAIALAVWVLSYVVEWVQPSRVSRSYYSYVLSAWVAPFLALIGYVLLNGTIGW